MYERRPGPVPRVHRRGEPGRPRSVLQTSTQCSYGARHSTPARCERLAGNVIPVRSTRPHPDEGGVAEREEEANTKPRSEGRSPPGRGASLQRGKTPQVFGGESPGLFSGKVSTTEGGKGPRRR